jgi:hypothetical protein
MIGTLLNERYRLDAELGRGGLGKGRLREAQTEVQAMGAYGYVDRVKTRLETLGAA